MSKSRNVLKIVLSLMLVISGSIALYFALNQESPSVCSDDTCEISTVTTPKKFSEYSWNDLAFIAQKIKDQPDANGVKDIAAHYNLIDKSGKLTDDVLKFKTTDGVDVEVRLIGVAADEGTGLTFMTASAPYYRGMNSTDTTEGSWKDSEVRKWLNEEVLPTLPQELKGAIKPVVKKTCNDDGRIDGTGTLQDTTDSLWLLSTSEIVGDVDWFQRRYPNEHYSELDKVISSQGSQYQYFKDHGVTGNEDPQGVLKLEYFKQPVSWWMRTPYEFKYRTIDSDYWLDVTSSGLSFNYKEPTKDSGIIYGFCL